MKPHFAAVDLLAQRLRHIARRQLRGDRVQQFQPEIIAPRRGHALQIEIDEQVQRRIEAKRLQRGGVAQAREQRTLAHLALAHQRDALMRGDGAVQPFQFTLAAKEIGGVGDAVTIEEWIADLIHDLCLGDAFRGQAFLCRQVTSKV